MKNPYKNYLQNGTIRVGVNKNFKDDLYYFLLGTSWIKLFFIVLLIYLILNFIFGLCYLFIPNSINNSSPSIFDAFFFSVQTFSTIGYGALSPTGQLSNFIVSIEAVIGLIYSALTTGIFFAKISKPSAKIRFSKNAIINRFNNINKFTFRMCNTRGNDLVEAKVDVSVLVDEVTKEGIRIRRIKNLPLERSFTPFFNLTWSIYHQINENSPLYRFEENENLLAIIVTLTGHDGTFSNTIYGRHIYTPDLIVQNKYFEDVMQDTEKGIMLDYSKFDLLKE